jgi:hypothetical protein
MCAVARFDEFLENVIQGFVFEIALFFDDPFLQPEMWFDDEFPFSS